MDRIKELALSGTYKRLPYLVAGNMLDSMSAKAAWRTIRVCGEDGKLLADLPENRKN
jgi:hypothetical protein